MNKREDEFLKRAFGDYQMSESLGSGFNQKVLAKIELSRSNKNLIIDFLKIYIPVLVLCLSAAMFILFTYGEVIFTFIQSVLPVVLPWHIILVIGIIYFHFVRSILFLAFIYIKKQLNIVLPIPSFSR